MLFLGFSCLIIWNASPIQYMNACTFCLDSKLERANRAFGSLCGIHSEHANDISWYSFGIRQERANGSCWQS